MHHTRSLRAGGEPVLGLQALARQVALAVQDRLRLAGRAGRERDQARVVRRRARRAAAARARASSPQGTQTVGPAPAGGAQDVLVALVADHEPRGRSASSRSSRSCGRSCSVQGSDDVALAEAGDHRQHPLRAVADQREDDVAAPHAELVQVGGERGRAAAATSPKRPLAAGRRRAASSTSARRPAGRPRRRRGRSSRHGGPEVPLAGHAAQLVAPALLEAQPGADDEVLDRARDEHLAGAGAAAITRAAMWTASPPTSSPIVSISPVCSPARRASPSAGDLGGDGVRGAHGAGRAVEGREEAVADRLDLAPAVAAQAGAHDAVVRGRAGRATARRPASRRARWSRRCR